MGKNDKNQNKRVALIEKHENQENGNVTFTFPFSEQSRTTSYSAFSDEYPQMAKLEDFEAYMAVCKAYCAANIINFPTFFQHGGWLVGILATNIGCGVATFCALKLIECSFKSKSYTYPKIVKKAFGPIAELFLKLGLIIF